MARIALRLLVVAIAKQAGTIAQGRVYDSQLAAVDPKNFGEDARPTIIITTDADKGSAVSDQNGGPPFHRQIEVTFDLSMVAREKVDKVYVPALPETDAQLEASLDLLEYQILRELTNGIGPLVLLFQRLARITSHERYRQVDDEHNVKLASRLMTLTCEMSTDDDEPVYNSGGVIPSGFDLLPEPLRSVAAVLPENSYGRDICAKLAASLSPVTAGPLEGVDLTMNLGGTEHSIVAEVDLDQVDPPLAP
jgi:hypothetical protein